MVFYILKKVNNKLKHPKKEKVDGTSNSQDRDRVSDIMNRYQDDPLLSGRGSAAIMSPSEPAFKLLKSRYSETFALTLGDSGRVHLFIIKVGMWALAWTFAFGEIPEAKRSEKIDAALKRIEDALSGSDAPLLEKLDSAVMAARERIRKRAERIGLARK